MRTSIALLCLAALAVAQEKPAPSPTPIPSTKPVAAPQGGNPPMGWTGVLDEKAFAALHDLKAEKAPKPEGVMVQVGDQHHYLALPKTGKAPFPAVLLIHEWWGLNDHIKHWADRLAADGYATLAVDLYGGKVATTREEASATMQSVDEAKAKATLSAAFDFLATDSRIQAKKRASLGWCFGGGWSLQLALLQPKLDAAVIYYGRLVDDSKALAAIQAPVLGVFGNLDKGIPPKSVDAFEAAMKAAGRDCRILRYEANHAFANPSAQSYDQANAAKAWTEVRAFLAARLKGEEAAGKAPEKAGK